LDFKDLLSGKEKPHFSQRTREMGHPPACQIWPTRRFVYNAAMRDQMLPRKPMPHPELDEQRKAPLKNVMPGARAKEDKK